MPKRIAGQTDAPLVSVVIRSVDRPELAEALASLQAQTYPAIEAVVVDANGRHGPSPGGAGHVAVRLISQGKPLARSRAANFGIDAARGRYLAFLDDDDLFLPPHLARLVEVLQARPEARAAYGGTDVLGAEGVIDVYDADFDPLRLFCWNHLPTASVLIERSLVEDGVRFDEAIDLYEDWDFWLQVSRRTPFARSAGVTAVYRPYLGASGMVDPARTEELRAARRHVWAKWLPRLAPAEFEQLVQSFRDAAPTPQIDLARAVATERNLRRLLERERAEVRRRDEIVATRDALLTAQTQDRLAALAERDAVLREVESLRLEVAGLRRALAEIQASTVWRISAPLRRGLDRLRARRRSGP